MSNKIIVTSALPYINAVKHLGNLVGSLLPADVFTRYLKLKGKDAIYICGTDDHGTPAELAALEAGKPVDEFCDDMYGVQKNIYERFGLGFDFFGRTHHKENHEITQQLFLGLRENGYIREETSVQLYSVDDERFLPDRYVIGTCPHCGYERARGDQCENCTTLMDPEELINPRSVISGSENIEHRDVTHFYIDLPKLEPKIAAWLETQTDWPTTSKSIAKKWLNEGLQVRAITRNLKWGIDLPIEGHDDKVFYVWFDAPIGYISITKRWATKIIQRPELFDTYWHDKSTKYYQFLGIDNVPFHSITFPGTLIGFNENRPEEEQYNLTNFIKGFQWLTYEKGKFSTSQNRGVFMDDALDLYPADYWRYYLLLIAPERQDTDFQWDGFQNAVNNDLNNLLGNLVNRFLTFAQRHFDGQVPQTSPGEREEELYKVVEETLEVYDTTFNEVEFQKPVKALRALWQECNRYFQEKRPWETVKEEQTKSDAATTISTIGHALRTTAILAAPIIPFTAEKIFEIVGEDGPDVHQIRWDAVYDWHTLAGNSVPELKENLFTKVSDEEIAELKQRYGSSEDLIEASQEEEVADAYTEGDESILIEYEDFAKVNLITAKVVAVEDHPNADKLIVLTIDDGTRDDRQVVAGIKGYYTEEELIGKNIVIVDNLKPAKLRGVTSEGMLLAADGDGDISVLQPIRDVAPGTLIK